MAIFYDPRTAGESCQLENAQLMDIAPTVLELLDVPIPPEMQGVPLRERAANN
jgi:bisphosphoglycerate-independent phosphoglycerate mutase (AlkP superfamily)